MRRKDREITDESALVDMIRRCQVARIALNDDRAPYIIPMNFGYARENGERYLYFHCAREGKKLDLIAKDPNVAFEMEASTRLVLNEKACKSTMLYESLCGVGEMELLPPEENLRVLRLVMAHYSDKEHSFGPNQVLAVRVMRLRIREMTGKRAELPFGWEAGN